jgi:hypothetical protein
MLDVRWLPVLMSYERKREMSSTPPYHPVSVESETTSTPGRLPIVWGWVLGLLGAWFVLSGTLGVVASSPLWPTAVRLFIALQVLAFGVASLGSGISLVRRSSRASAWLFAAAACGAFIVTVALARGQILYSLVAAVVLAGMLLPPWLSTRHRNVARHRVAPPN